MIVDAYTFLKEKADATTGFIAGAGLRATEGLAKAAEDTGEDAAHLSFRASQWERYKLVLFVLGGGIGGVLALLFLVGG